MILLVEITSLTVTTSLFSRVTHVSAEAEQILLLTSVK